VRPPLSCPAVTRRLLILGSTGSIGTQALEVVAHLRALGHDLRVVGLAAGSNAPLLYEQAHRAGVRDVALAANGAAAPDTLRVREGPDAAERLVREVECDVVLAAMVGVAGLPATLAGVELGRDVALANKETLVAAGSLVVPAAQRSGARLLPVDSEHSGVWQALRGRFPSALPARPDPGAPPMRCPGDVARITLTASGGPFRTWTREQMARATPEQALRHPTWRMGRKVTIDSASLMNKALELIEAHWLFGLEADRLDAVIHPQSIVHALVEFADGSVVAQLGVPDMRLPIQIALAYPARVPGTARRVDLCEVGRLDFEPADPGRFPALAFARRAMELGGAAGAVLNAANEAAVAAFLRGEGAPAFGAIADLVGEALERVRAPAPRSLEDVLAADAEARRWVESRLARGVGR
jgi:1-deoxy-D-xylulose-5-phosphate reductoisomerase